MFAIIQRKIPTTSYENSYPTEYTTGELILPLHTLGCLAINHPTPRQPLTHAKIRRAHRLCSPRHGVDPPRASFSSPELQSHARGGLTSASSCSLDARSFITFPGAVRTKPSPAFGARCTDHPDPTVIDRFGSLSPFFLNWLSVVPYGRHVMRRPD